MKLGKRYIIYITLLLLLVVAFISFIGKGENWNITFYKKDKNPFGAYILHDLLAKGDIFKSYSQSNKSLYELRGNSADNFLVLCEQFQPVAEDMATLFKMLEEGKNVMILAHVFASEVNDTFGISTANLDIEIASEGFFGDDLSRIKMLQHVPGPSAFTYPSRMVSYYFNKIDTANMQVIATNEKGYPTVVARSIGKGNLVLGTIPLTFTNFGMLYRDNYPFVADLLSYLPGKDIHFADYYQFGRLESGSPLRYILSEPSWRIAIYVFLLGAVLYILFESKRRRKAIPVLVPLKNTSLEFAKTVGRLYYQRRNHRDLVEKKILYFKDYLRRNFYINLDDRDVPSAQKIASKLAVDVTDVEALFSEMEALRKRTAIQERDLIRINNLIEKIYNR